MGKRSCGNGDCVRSSFEMEFILYLMEWRFDLQSGPADGTIFREVVHVHTAKLAYAILEPKVMSQSLDLSY